MKESSEPGSQVALVLFRVMTPVSVGRRGGGVGQHRVLVVGRSGGTEFGETVRHYGFSLPRRLGLCLPYKDLARHQLSQGV